MALSGGKNQAANRLLALTVEAAAYASGDVIGGLLSFTNVFPLGSHAVTIHNVIVHDNAAQTGALTLILFNANPSATTFTENSALDVADADLSKIVGKVTLNTAYSFADNCILTSDVTIPIEKDFSSPNINTTSDPTLYGVLICEAARTEVATTDMSISLGMVRH